MEPDTVSYLDGAVIFLALALFRYNTVISSVVNSETYSEHE
jgi:hypothetical protein